MDDVGEVVVEHTAADESDVYYYEDAVAISGAVSPLSSRLPPEGSPPLRSDRAVDPAPTFGVPRNRDDDGAAAAQAETAGTFVRTNPFRPMTKRGACFILVCAPFFIGPIGLFVGAQLSQGESGVCFFTCCPGEDGPTDGPTNAPLTPGPTQYLLGDVPGPPPPTFEPTASSEPTSCPSHSSSPTTTAAPTTLSWEQVGRDLAGSIVGGLSDDGMNVVVGNTKAQFFRCRAEEDDWDAIGNEVPGKPYSLSGDGKRIAVGDPNYDNETHKDIGEVRIF